MKLWNLRVSYIEFICIIFESTILNGQIEDLNFELKQENINSW